MKNHFGKIHFTIVLLLLSFLSSCASLVPTATFPLIPTKTIPTATFTPSVTSTVSPTPRPTQQATRTPTVIPKTPTPTLTITPTYFYTREPSIEELNRHLSRIYADYDYYGLSENAILTYEDVNGDNETDLVVDDWLQVVVLLWTNDHYTAFWMGYPFEKYDPGSRVLLEDWTNDGILDVVFDYRGDTGGTGIKHSYWQRHIISCQESSCHLAWVGKMGAFSQENSLGGMDLYQAKIRLITNSNGELVLRRSSDTFAIYSSGFYLPFDVDWDTYHYDYLNVYTSTLSTYLWNGDEFELSDSEIVKLPYSIAGEATMSAYGPKNVLATISVESNMSADHGNDVCILYVNGTAASDPFGCKANFTTVEWRDITGDGILEVVVTALSGPEPIGQDWQQLSDVDCVHQHFLAYNWDGKNTAEIANVAGCVVGESLYGVRLEDYTGDGVLEILTPSDLFVGDQDCEINYGSFYDGNGCWYEIADDPGLRIYKFDGTKYVLWSDIPSQ